MRKPYPYRNSRLIRNSKKAMPVAAIAFFLSLALPSQAQLVSNEVSGNVYGDFYVTRSITTTNSGRGFLNILYSGTTNLTLAHNIEGQIIINNSFDSLSINGGSITVSNSDEVAVLQVINGTNLTLTGGTFSGNYREAGITPPTPGIPSETNSAPEAALGGYIEGVSNVIIDGTSFSGGSLRDSNGNATGKDGLYIINSTATFTTNGPSSLSGGDASGSGNAGNGLTAFDSSLVISNGTFTGGTGATADRGGAGLYATFNSDIIITDGTFSGGGEAPALYLENSDLITYGGDFSSGGLYSTTTAGETNRLTLMGGEFGEISLINALTSGVQMLTISNLTLSGMLTQQNGSVFVDNQDNSTLKNLSIKTGSLFVSNAFTLVSGGEVSLGSADGTAEFWVNGDLTIESNSTLSIKNIKEESSLISATGDINFQSNSVLSVDTLLVSFGAGSHTSTLLQATGQITVNGVAADTNNFFEGVILQTNLIGRTQLAGISLPGNSLAFEFETAALKDFWHAEAELATLADDLDNANHAAMMAIIDQLDAEVSRAAAEEAYFSTANSAQTALQGLHAAVGQSISRGTEFREGLHLPPGANGPDRPASEWRPWMKYYGQFLQHDHVGANSGYDTTLHGGVLGIDKAFGPLLVGISAGSGNYHIDSDNGSQQDMSSAHGGVYSTIGKEHAYLDVGIVYGHNHIKSKTAAPFVLDGDFNAHLIGAHIGGGYGVEFTDIGMVITPEVNLQYTTYEQEAYTETSTTAVPRSFEEFDTHSLRYSLGLNTAMLNTRVFETFSVKIEGRAHWVHESKPGTDDQTFQLQGSATSHSLDTPDLEEDMIKVGVGLTFFNTKPNSPKNVLFRIDFDELISDKFNSHNLSAKAIYAF